MNLTETRTYANQVRHLSTLLEQATEAAEQQQAKIEEQSREIERLRQTLAGERTEPTTGNVNHGTHILPEKMIRR